MKSYGLLLSLFFLPGILIAQRRHTVKTDLTAWTQKGLRFAYEYRLNDKSSLELSIGFHRHETPPDWIFNGDQIVHYLQRKLDTFDFANRFVQSTGWQYSESQPLPDAPDYLPLRSENYRIGWRFNFEKRRSNWRFFLQPGIQLANLHFFEVKGERRLESQMLDSWTIGNFPYKQRIDRISAVYEQTRSMRIKNEWFGGITYDLGLVRKWGKHFQLEGRLSAGGNLSLPYKSPRPPITLRGLWVQPVLMLGWGF